MEISGRVARTSAFRGHVSGEVLSSSCQALRKILESAALLGYCGMAPLLYRSMRLKLRFSMLSYWLMSRLVQAMPAWSVKTRRAFPSVPACRDARVYVVKTAAISDMIHPPPQGEILCRGSRILRQLLPTVKTAPHAAGLPNDTTL